MLPFTNQDVATFESVALVDRPVSIKSDQTSLHSPDDANLLIINTYDVFET